MMRRAASCTRADRKKARSRSAPAGETPAPAAGRVQEGGGAHDAADASCVSLGVLSDELPSIVLDDRIREAPSRVNLTRTITLRPRVHLRASLSDLPEQSMHFAQITRNRGPGSWIARITSTSASRGCFPSVSPVGWRMTSLL